MNIKLMIISQHLIKCHIEGNIEKFYEIIISLLKILRDLYESEKNINNWNNRDFNYY
jgi:hypothetical protein